MSLHLYKPLTSNDPQTRLNAASNLTSELIALVQSDSNVHVGSSTDTPHATTSAPSTTDTSPVPTSANSQKKNAKEEIIYALNRLIKGLASGHESARFGFAVVLTEYLNVLLQPHNQTKWGVDVEMVLGLVHKWMGITEHLSRTEERDRWLGRLFGLKAVVMSGCLFPPGGGGEEIGHQREVRTVVGEMLDLGKEKSWLREPGMWAVVAAARKFHWGKGYVRMVWRMVVERNLARTSEGVGVWLCFEQLCPGAMEEEEEEEEAGGLGKVWGDGKWGPLVMGNLGVVAKVLKESGAAGAVSGEKARNEIATSSREKDSVGGKGTWSPKLHWVWDEIIRIYLAAESEKRKKNNDINQRDPGDFASFQQFWRVVVDGN